MTWTYVVNVFLCIFSFCWNIQKCAERDCTSHAKHGSFNCVWIRLQSCWPHYFHSRKFSLLFVKVNLVSELRHFILSLFWPFRTWTPQGLAPCLTVLIFSQSLYEFFVCLFPSLLKLTNYNNLSFKIGSIMWIVLNL